MTEPRGCENQIGPRIKRLGHAMNRAFMEHARENGIDEITVISGRIMGLIYHNPDRDIFQKDVEEAFHITRSSVTSVVQLMEKRGYITREPVAYDARLKKLVLTRQGREAHDRAMLALLATEDTAASALTEEEKAQFMRLCDKLIAAMESEKKAGEDRC